VAFRFLQERKFERGEDPPEEFRTYYSTLRLLSCEVTSSGPALGEIVTEVELIDPQEETVLGRCRSTYRVWRSRPAVEIELELTPEQMPDGDPWSCYFASRFAWKHESAALTRGLLQGAHGLQGERFEAPYFLEIADGDLRTTIVPDGLPFHRRSGPRMVDSILISAGESARTFRFWIAFDEPYPMQAAHRMLMPPVAVRSEKAPASSSGWFFRMKEKNVQLLSLQPIVPDPHAESPAPDGFTITLLETEGRNRRVKLRPFRTPLSARKRDLQGNLLEELSIQRDAVIIDMRGHELAHVELIYSEPAAETTDENS
jgi:alpha-mannosidase